MEIRRPFVLQLNDIIVEGAGVDLHHDMWPRSFVCCGIIGQDPALINLLRSIPSEDFAEIANFVNRSDALASVPRDPLGRVVVFTDGSCLIQSNLVFRRAGWGVWFANTFDNSALHPPWSADFFSLLRGLVQSSERAEARALLYAIVVCDFSDIGAAVHLDNEMGCVALLLASSVVICVTPRATPTSGFSLPISPVIAP